MFCWRSRLKKDYDDFKKQPDHDKFTREQWTNEDGEVNTGIEVSTKATSESPEHNELLKRDYTDTGKSFASHCECLVLAYGSYFSQLESGTTQDTSAQFPPWNLWGAYLLGGETQQFI